PLHPKTAVTDTILAQESHEQLIEFFLLCFLSFRFFDIIKMWPIDLIDKNIKSSFGVMINGTRDPLFNFVFCKSDFSMQKTLDYLHKIDVEATWVRPSKCGISDNQ
ncbi:MAG: phosphatidylglycerophosphatase A, partial [Candidatus Cardinium sp.]|nr:phosphatidylglycerophosphatase A [Candidatus Cardinium sp.]